MKVVGIDLAGNPKNDTGFCTLEVYNDKKNISTKIVHTDEDILEEIEKENPVLTAIDAPLTYSGERRTCDDELDIYGALPVTLRGMETLALRGTGLAEKLNKKNISCIEVFSKATAKILGLQDKSDAKTQKNLITAGITGTLEKRMLGKDELDSVFAAITAYMHINSLTGSVGEKERITIPKV